MLEKLIQDALILWATIDPIGTMGIFAALTVHLSPVDRRRTAYKVVIYAGAVLMGSIVIGQLLLSTMGIRLLSFQLSGGIILFLFGLQMIFGSGSRQSRNEPEHDIVPFFLWPFRRRVYNDRHPPHHADTASLFQSNNLRDWR